MPHGNLARHSDSNSFEESGGLGVEPHDGGLHPTCRPDNRSTLYPDGPSTFYRPPRSSSVQTSVRTLPRSALSDRPDHSASTSNASSETPSAPSSLSDTTFWREPLGPRWHDYSFRESDLYYNASPQRKSWGTAEATPKASATSRLWGRILGTPGLSSGFQVTRAGGPSSGGSEAKKDTKGR